MPAPPASPLLARLPLPERARVLEVLREETVGGALLLAAAAVAVVWASSPWSAAYDALRDIVVGPAALHLDLTLQQWAADGLLAVFFLVAGLELKREVVLGQLRNPAEAVLPVVAAVAGMVVPAAAYLLVVLPSGDAAAARGWAVPMATDIAVALAVLAVLGRRLPTALRAFLLTLAVVDDLGAVLVIAVAYTAGLAWVPLAGAVAVLAAYAAVQRLATVPWWLAGALGLAAWVLVHASGVHATVAGVAVGLLTRVRRDAAGHSRGEHVEHVLRPFSAGFAVPVFALLSAGVSLSGAGLRGDVAVAGVAAGLVVGKPVGVLAGTWLTVRLTRARLHPDLAWADLAGLALLTGIGFTVSLLLAELSFPADPGRADAVKAAVLAGSVVSALLAAVVLRRRARARRDADDDDDGRDLGPA